VIHVAERDVLPEIESPNPAGTDAFRRYRNQVPITSEIFLTAGTEKRDHLSQWRDYGRGQGYSLGFDANALAQAANEVGWRLVPCIYNIEQQKHLLRCKIQAFYDGFERGELGRYEGPPLDRIDNENFENEVFAAQLFGYLLPLAAKLKHSGFEDENEWRLISPLTLELATKHRVGAATLVPYVTFRLPHREDGVLDIQDTVIGPTPQELRDRALHAVMSLYREKRCGQFDPNDTAVHGGVGHSEIPYRDW
jgi:hypothetical protein